MSGEPAFKPVTVTPIDCLWMLGAYAAALGVATEGDMGAGGFVRQLPIHGGSCRPVKNGSSGSEGVFELVQTQRSSMSVYQALYAALSLTCLGSGRR